jgi:glycosyltransferase involved in cell wall biosynthesis
MSQLSIDISIVVPTYQSETCIEIALRSIVEQEEVAFEVIVVDGGSTDNTCAIVRDIPISQLTLISEPDDGIYDAINKGISRASGDLIGILGSDDKYLPLALKRVVERRRETKADIIAGRTLIDGTLRKDEPYGLNALISGIPFGHNAMFASQAAYRTVGNYDLGLKLCADAAWVHKAIILGVSCSEIDEGVVEFGTGGESSVQSQLIMEEAYEVIRRNFPFLSIADAKYLLYAVRDWGPRDDIEKILESHGRDQLLSIVVAAAFPSGGEPKVNLKSSLKALVRKLVGRKF